jgi:hypothetical protein
MDSREAVFVEVMIGIALVAVLAFMVLLLARRVRPARPDDPDQRDAAQAPTPLAVVLATVVLVAAAAIVVWQLPHIVGERGPGPRWMGDGRQTGFLIAMLAVAALGLIAFVVLMVDRSGMFVPSGGEPRSAVAGAEPASGQPIGIETPSAARLVGLLGLALALLLLGWVYLPAERQYAMMLHLVYPAEFAVALVLLFDKATRGWSAKTAAESVREWLLGDLFVFLLVLGYLNLEGSGAAETYASAPWDLIHVALFFVVFWTVDRKLTRYRFLIGYGYLVVLPIGLLAWRATQGTASPEGLTWWTRCGRSSSWRSSSSPSRRSR